MLTKFSVRNYKNFKDTIIMDFEKTAGYQFNTDCLSNGMIGKMLIYGRNATGKTNLGKALLDIGSAMFGNSRYNESGILLNADSKEDAAVFSYEFRFDDNKLLYRYSRSSNRELHEELLKINGKTVFKIDFCSNGNNSFDLGYVGAETANVERYMQALDSNEEDEISKASLPFLRWLISNAALENDSVLIKLSNYVRRMMMITVGSGMQFRFRGVNQHFYELLESPERLNDFEEFLNAMGIECKLTLKSTAGAERIVFCA